MSVLINKNHHHYDSNLTSFITLSLSVKIIACWCFCMNVKEHHQLASRYMCSGELQIIIPLLSFVIFCNARVD